MPLATTHLLQAAFAVSVEVAVHGAQGDAGEVGDLPVRQAVALQPQHLHLALDERVRVVIAAVSNRLPIVVSKGEYPHGRLFAWALLCFPCVVYARSQPPAFRAASPRAGEKRWAGLARVWWPLTLTGSRA